MQILKGQGYLHSLAFSPDGTRIAASAARANLFLWELGTGTHRVMGNYYTFSGAFSPDGSTIATGCDSHDPEGDGDYSQISLWDLAGEKERILKTDVLPGSYQDVKIAFMPDGRMILVGGNIRVWDSVAGEAIPSPGLAIEGEVVVRPDYHSRPYKVRATHSLAVTADHRLMATGHIDIEHRPSRKFVRIWDLATFSLRDEIVGLNAGVSALAWIPNGRYLAAVAQSKVWVWTMPSKKVVFNHSNNTKHLTGVAFTPDSRYLLIAGNDGTVSLWDTFSWTEAACYNFQIGKLASLACAPDGMRAAAGSEDGTIVVWDID